MTTVALWQNEQGCVTRLRASGHAGYAEAGSDIVCAAVSVLMTTCVNALESAASAKPLLKTDEAKGIIDIWVQNASSRDVQTVIRTVMCGLNDLSEAYPKHVQIKVMGGSSSC